MPLPAYPQELENRTWQKKKSKLAGETGIGARLEALEAAYKHIRADLFVTLENARSMAELEHTIEGTEPEMPKVQAAAKAFREFALHAPRKAAELSKNKLIPKDTLRLVEQLGRVAEDFD